MKTEQSRWSDSTGWISPIPMQLGESAKLVLLFGSNAALFNESVIQDIKTAYPNAQLFGCSTAGEIYNTEVTDDTLVCTALQFDATRIRGAQVKINEVTNSFEAGVKLAHTLKADDLQHVLILSDGLKVNGSELVSGVTSYLPKNVSVTGGLSGDGDRFERTTVFWGSPSEDGAIATLGFYGQKLRVSYSSLGGWDPFGPQRRITRSKGNVLYELDSKSALELYKNYLGEHAKGLPATGLLFPLSIKISSNDTPVVRTILSVNEDEQSMTFAGDVPEGAYAQLMKANFDRLIDGSVNAAKISREEMGSGSPELALLISCVGRKLVLKQRVEEEVEGVRDVMGEHTMLTGFYSYGEISPFTPSAKCELHNQTMTITTFSEKELEPVA